MARTRGVSGLRSVLLVLVGMVLVSCALPRQRILDAEQRADREQFVRTVLSDVVRLLREGSQEALTQADGKVSLLEELGDEKDPRIVDARGCVAFRLGAEQVAFAYFKRAIELDRGYDRAYVHLALVAERRGDRQAAFQLLSIALALNPLNYRGRHNRLALIGDRPGLVPGVSRESLGLEMEMARTASEAYGDMPPSAQSATHKK